MSLRGDFRRSALQPNSVVMSWPYDADGDVLRQLKDGGFDFSQPTLIDFEVDFQSWPPSPTAFATLSRHYPSFKIYEPDDEHEGYLHFQVYALVTYELVTSVQIAVTELMAPFRGECCSWGVLVTPPSTS
jgi:hypothetical protein